MKRTIRYVGLDFKKDMITIAAAARDLESEIVGTAPNVAARLEGLTKYLGAPILLSSDCRAYNPPGIYRRLLEVRPASMDKTVEGHELVLPREFGGSGVDEEACRRFEKGFWSDDDPVACALRKLGVEQGSDAVLDMLQK